MPGAVPFSEIRDAGNTFSRKRCRLSPELSSKRQKRDCAVKAETLLSDHYSTSFEDSQIPSQLWYSEEFQSQGMLQNTVKEEPIPSSLHTVPSAPPAEPTEMKPKKKAERVELNSMTLVSDSDTTILQLQTDLNRAESSVRLLRAQLDQERQAASSKEDRYVNQLAQLELDLTEARVDKVIAEKLREKKALEVREQREQRQALERKMRVLERERDSAVVVKQDVERELRGLKAKLTSLLK
ncbi:hypothetical protein V5O48_017415 [Marasmius crinis-equi]|uniref:Uncharacterized protein n=1 Tax=Marasmius crinis-equi TaxID=585013 RepID=A0ABR3EP07_9AGAR